MGKSRSDQVKHRRVFYIPGYDPIHPRRYRELYRKESAAQAEISGYNVDLKPKKVGGNYGWHVNAQIDDADVAVDVEVLVWSDIVRGSMKTSILATYVQLIRTAWVYITTGALWRLMKLRKGPVIAALYPVGMLLAQLGTAIFAAWVMVQILAFGFGQVEQRVWPDQLNTPLMWPVIVVMGLSAAGTFAGVLRWFKKKDGTFFAYYLMHDYAYSAATRGANPPDLEARMTEFRMAIAKALREDVDEVLVVGHSSGAHLGVSVLADLIRNNDMPDAGAKLAFLSLGQVVPMVSFLPDAHRLRADLRYLSARDELTWIDVTAPGDGCAFALCDPVAVTGVAPNGKKWPLVFSAAFTQTLSPARWKELRWRFFRLHFQYLCAFDRPKDYDYFKITAGPMTLGARYADRRPSKSRIDAPVNKFTSLTA
jgi:hypothetical protein